MTEFFRHEYFFEKGTTLLYKEEVVLPSDLEDQLTVHKCWVYCEENVFFDPYRLGSDWSIILADLPGIYLK